jgi:hypothetical protein
VAAAQENSMEPVLTAPRNFRQVRTETCLQVMLKEQRWIKIGSRWELGGGYRATGGKCGKPAGGIVDR